MHPLVSPMKPALGFVTAPLATNDGYCWALTSLLGSFLRELEEKYGPREKDWTPLGIEFHGEIPMIWYPGNCKSVSIMLTESASLNPQQAIYQLAHEAVHLLSPSGGRETLVVEEGMANSYAREIAFRYGFQVHNVIPSYEWASKLQTDLEIHRSDAIRFLRKARPVMHEWTSSFLHQQLPEIPYELIEGLCARFHRDA